MAVSKVDICNRALARIHSKGINSFDEQSIEADYCRLFYYMSVDFMLSDSVWSFARKQVTLAKIASTQVGWSNYYQYPADCINVISIVQLREDGSIDTRYQSASFEAISGDDNTIIGTNCTRPAINYQSRQESDRFTPKFITALEWYLAAELAMPIIGGNNGRNARNDALVMYKRTLLSAITTNANERKQKEKPDSEFVLARQ